jgi:dTDP-4-dehydrorhamnose reductase
MNNVLVVGANGQLGQSIKEIHNNYNYNFIFASKIDLDIVNEKDILKYVKQNNINTIINCAGYTNVDKAESEQELATNINVTAVKYLAKISNDNNIKFIHVSTDYVFDGEKNTPYIETDITNPMSIYGQTKLDGENHILKIGVKNSIIIRTSWLYSPYNNNFLKTIHRISQTNKSLNIIYDQIGTPTYALNLAKVILDIIPKIDNQTTQIYHYSNEGVSSWFDFASDIVSLLGISCAINPIHSYEYKMIATRPKYSVFSKSKIKKDFDINIPYWRDSLSQCIKVIKK